MSSSKSIADEQSASLTAAASTPAGTRVRSAGHGRSRVDVAGRDATRSDEELVFASVKGDLQAFAVLCDRMAGLVAHNVQRLLGQGGRAQDVVQATFLDVLRDAAHFDPAQGSAQVWVLTHLHPDAKDPVRSEQRCPGPIDTRE